MKKLICFVFGHTWWLGYDELHKFDICTRCDIERAHN